MRDIFESYKNKKLDELEHINKISYYNHNYYFALNNKDIIYAISDDDNLTEYYYIDLDNLTKTHFAYSYTSENNVLHVFKNKDLLEV